MTEPISKQTDFSHGQRIAGMAPEKSHLAYSQAHETHASFDWRTIGRRVGGLLNKVLYAVEEPKQEERISMKDITMKKLAGRLSGTEKGTPPREDPFSAQGTLGEIGYPGDPLNNPYEYAAVIYAYDALREVEAIAHWTPEDPQQVSQFAISNLSKLNRIATDLAVPDESLSRTLSRADQKDWDAIVAGIIREHQSAT